MIGFVHGRPAIRIIGAAAFAAVSLVFISPAASGAAALRPPQALDRYPAGQATDQQACSDVRRSDLDSQFWM